MQKVLRSLCMGIAVAFSAASFAQTNMTDKLLNPDAEKGMLGWDVTFVDGGQIWNKQTKGEAKSAGYYGFDNWAFENWRNNAAGLTDGSIFQVVKDLPNGTYVFGAYAMATRDAVTPSIEEITGVSMFANEDFVPVATNRVEGIDEQWGHAIKFNVATVATDGTLKVGMKTEATTASFVAMDNATLYYFGDMSKEEALLEMAKIDIAATVEFVTPTLTAGKMNVDTLAVLEAALEAAKGEITVENATQLNTDLYWGRRVAKKSIAAYATLAEALSGAREIAAQEWSDVEETIAALEALKELIAACEEKYDEGSALNSEATAWAAELDEAGALVELDSCYLRAVEYYAAMDTLTLGDEIGQYTYADYERAQTYYDEIMTILADASAGEESALTAKSTCETLFGKIQQIIDNPIDYSEFPIWIYEGDELLPNQGSGTNNQAYPVLEGSYLINYPAGTDKNGNSYGARNNCAAFKSPLYRFRESLKSVRFIVHKSGSPTQVDALKNANICIGSFAMFDENGDEIPLSEENVYANCNEVLPGQSGGIPALLDGNPGTYFHSLWSAGTPQEHYIEVTLPDGEYSAFSFMMVAYSSNHTRAFPRELEITYVSEKVTDMQQAMVSARELYPVFGTAPGFNNLDLTPFKTALAEADELVLKAKQNASSVSDDEVEALTKKIQEEAAKIQEAGVMMPEPGKKYSIISSEKLFLDNQNVQKAMTIHEGDTLRPNWLWWEDAHKDSVKQVFSFELIGEADDKVYYAIKHEATGKYVADWVDKDGNKDLNNAVFTLAEQPDSFELRALGNGEFAIGRQGFAGTYMHVLNHNNGVADPNASAQAGVGKGKGISSSIITWSNAAFDFSNWSIREMSVLPEATKNFSDLVFQSKTYTLYSNVNILTLKADKDCAFENLVIVDNTDKEQVITSLEVAGNVATVVLEANIASFSFTFDNAEGVEEVVVDGEYEHRGVSAAYTALQNKYNTVLAVAPVEGTDVGQVSDLSEYNAALKAADVLLTNGAEDAELEAAALALDSAQAHLVYNLPKEGVDYLILLGIDAIKTNHLTDMAVYADRNVVDAAGNVTLRWTYVSLTNPEYRWRFINCGELKHGQSAYYIQSAVTDGYVTRTVESNASIYLSEDTTATRPYEIFFLTNGKVALADSYWANGGQSLHPNGHGGGAAANKGRNMITWGKHDAASAMYVVEAEKYITDVIFSINDIEEIEVADEQVAPAVKGIFDLFGRRIENPAATGIYIIDGKKQVIKK